MGEGDKVVASADAKNALDNCLYLRTEALYLLSSESAQNQAGRGSGQSNSSPEKVLGFDVAFTVDHINQAENSGVVDFIAQNGLSDFIRRSYGRGFEIEKTLSNMGQAPDQAAYCSGLGHQAKLDLLRYRFLHDALVNKSEEFASNSISANDLLQQWEGGFLRPTEQPPTWSPLYKLFRKFERWWQK
jgi:hypothetical protein